MGTVWEVDFYSRPILDENNKKRWEVLISEGLQTVDADPEAAFRYSKFLSNTEVNSIELKKAIEEAIAQAPTPPDRIRFFRFSMQNMITRACEDLGLPVQASRRTLALKQWMDYRKTEVYPNEPGYTDKPSPSVGAPPPAPQPLPDALIGQQWALVTLPAGDLADMPEWPISFGEAFPTRFAGLEPDTLVPGLVMFSSRALPMAGWLSGLEISELRIEAGKVSRLILETGSADSWVVAVLNTPELQKEAQNFEATKARANQVHFLAVQDNPETEAFAGFWLMQGVQLG
ncbi:Tab2/Atab2 family RNA-binding protein [Oscillatoria sp. CS-180]|uniref:Tab2/Atab2 family RNA-binding protein n=1 Tax=Oscillatoria sp. CS-180 TaxID=3021720 RepID=UPI00232FDCE2|nr:Tab2/Atab2 family RNA-binding protein [Oscillatoria sp. CS-180]MDB9524553.1 Tab2/Atab2 family RNA-binding protein [Oscillatoria sp. CS-180]